jgi:hypothetical protein
LPIIDQSPEVGSTVMLGGYQQDHPLVLMWQVVPERNSNHPFRVARHPV